MGYPIRRKEMKTGIVNGFYKANQYIIICPECKKVKKHRTWLKINDLTPEQKKLVLLYLDGNKKMEVKCPQCSKNGKK